jgi:hypothetical protein
MKIVRKENGNVLLTDDSGNTIKRLPEYAVLELKSDREGEFVRVAYGHQNKHDIYSNQITATQIEPAAEVAFNGTAQDLLNLLSTSFFFEVSGGGYAGDDYIDTYFYSVDVTNTDTYPFLIHTEEIPLDNAISFEVDYIGFRTDTIGIGKRQSLAKYAANDGGTISVATTAASLTSSNYSITASIIQNGSNLELQIDGAGGDVTYNFWIKIRKINK